MHTVNLLSSPYEPVRERAILGIFCYIAYFLVLIQFASHHHEMRDYLLSHNVIKPLVMAFNGVFQVQGTPNLGMLRMATLCLSILCGYTHTKSPDFMLVKDSLMVLSQLLFAFGSQFDDPRAFVYICNSLAFLLPFVHEENVIVKLLSFVQYA